MILDSMIILIIIAAFIGLILIKKIHHKIIGIIIIILGVFIYFSFTFVSRSNNLDLSTLSGILKAISLYFSWLKTTFDNLQTITAHAIRMEWLPKYNNSI